MSTATIPRVRSVTAASTAAGSMFSVTGSTSAKTGLAPSNAKQFADATKESGDVITSSPDPKPAIWHKRCNPPVPLESAAAYGAPTRSAICSSNRSIQGPRDSRPERSTSTTARSSASPTTGRASGICSGSETSDPAGMTVDSVGSITRSLSLSRPSPVRARPRPWRRAARAACRTPANRRARPRRRR